MQRGLNDDKKQIAELTRMVETLRELVVTLQAENKLLHQKHDLLIRRLFGRKSEKLDARQLELLLNDLSALVVSNPEPAPDDQPPRPRGPRAPRAQRLPEDLPTEEIVLDPDEVKRDPNAWRCIGEDVTEELDVKLPQYLRRLYIRRKYVAREDRKSTPVQAAMPARPIANSFASPGLLADIVIKKYMDHLPLFRQEQILKNRHGIHLSRQTMSEWIREVADWLRPIYEHLRDELRRSGYLQVDETPVRYTQAEGGGSAMGFFWAYRDPVARQVLFEWHTGRSASCLDGMCTDFVGWLQSDGYAVYEYFARMHAGIELLACWAHARRKFHEARDEDPAFMGWILHQIGLLYRVEARMRERGASATLRGVARASESRMVLERIGRALRKKLTAYLPQSLVGKAIAYALGRWEELARYLEEGRLEIDNNGIENAIRPTAVGKKNWLFIGHPEAGDRSAILYTILANCRASGIQPGEYLKDVLTRLPSMKIGDTAALTPTRWKAEREARAA